MLNETADRQKSVAFTGHRRMRTADLGIISKQLCRYMETAIAQGYTTFYSGMALGFDTVAAQTVLKYKRDHPELSLICALPGKNQTALWKETDIAVFNTILKQADKIIYPCGEDAIVSRETYFARDDYMVDNSAALIYYCYDSRSGTGHTVRYAQKQGLELFSIL